MALPVADKIIKRAEAGERVSTQERRHAVAYLMQTEFKTNAEMAEMFAVSPRTIRIDKQIIREEKKDQLKEDDIALVVVDLQMNIERQIRDLEVSKKACKIGTELFAKHCVHIAKLQLDLNAALRDLGFLPKNMGNMTIQNFDYRAVVARDGSVETRRVDALDHYIDAEVITPPSLTDGQKTENTISGPQPEGQCSSPEAAPSPAS